MSQELTFEIVPAESNLPAETKQSLEIAFSGFFTQAAEWKAQAETISDPKLARVARLGLKKVRTDAEKVHKNLKEDILRHGRAIDGAKNILLAYVVPIEKQLDDIEKAAERAEEARIKALAEARQEQLDEWEYQGQGNLGLLGDDAFESLLQDAKDVFAVRKERERQLELKRLEEAAEHQRIAAENIRLKKAAEERDALEAEREKAARVLREKELADLKAKRDAEIEQERLKRDKEIAEAEKQRKALQDAANKKLAEEKAACAVAEMKLKEAERVVKEKERLEKEKLEADKKAARAPDKDKILVFAAALGTVKLPEVKSKDATVVLDEIKEGLNDFLEWIEERANTL